MAGGSHAGLGHRDLARLALGAIRAHRLRSGLTALGIAVGVAAVVLLTSIGTGVQRFVVAEFTQFGTHLISVQPGKTQTTGIPGAILGTVRPLTIEDAASIRRLPHLVSVVTVVNGNAEVQARTKKRRTLVLGTEADVPRVFRFQVAQGRFLPAGSADASRALVVLGATLKRELFGSNNPLGERLRIGTENYRVIGVMESKGQLLGFDLDDAAYIPIQRSLDLYNRVGVMEIDILYSPQVEVESVVAAIKKQLIARHGREDFTIITQQQMLDILGAVLNVLTFAVGALGGISLAVGGVGILTIMTIAVNERTQEIGLLRALGATRRQVLLVFLTEAVVLAGIGGSLGLAAGGAGAGLLWVALPALPVHPAPGFAVAAEVVALLIGLSAGVLPARRAAALDPVDALRSE